MSAELEEVLRSLSGFYADAERRSRLMRLNAQLERQNSLLNVIAQMHTSTRSDQVCNILATDGSAVLGVDRVSVLIGDSGRAKLVAATGVVAVESRANGTRELERLAEACSTSSTDLPWTQVDELADTAVERAASDAGRLSGSRSIQALRLGSGRGVVVFEQFSSAVPTNDLAMGLLAQADAALSNVGERSRTGLGRLVVAGKRFFSNRWRWFAVAAMVVAALVLIPADFVVKAPGTLMPVVRRDVFAPEAGVVVDVLVTDSEVAAQNSVLLRMSNTEIYLSRLRIKGDIETVSSQLAAVTASRNSVNRQTGLSQAATEDELSSRIESLKRQLVLVDQQIESLEVRAPIDGEVSFGDLSRSLVGQPVQKGQFLLRMADPDQEWELLLRIPDNVVRHVLRGQGEGEQPVEFLVRMAPGQSYKATLDWIGHATDLDEHGELSVPARVKLDKSLFVDSGLPKLRPGATVIAKIDCGRRSLGYVWFRNIVDVIQTRLLF